MTTTAHHLATATAHLAALESDTPKLAVLKAEHAQAAETIRQQVRAGTATFDDLVTAEGRLAAASNLLEQHAREIAEAQERAETLRVQAVQAQYGERLAVLTSNLTVNLDQREALAEQFIHELECGLTALMENAMVCQELAIEAVTLSNRLGQRPPHEVAEQLGQSVVGSVHSHLMGELTFGALEEALRDALRDGLHRVLAIIEARLERQQ